MGIQLRGTQQDKAHGLFSLFPHNLLSLETFVVVVVVDERAAVVLMQFLSISILSSFLPTVGEPAGYVMAL